MLLEEIFATANNGEDARLEKICHAFEKEDEDLIESIVNFNEIL